MNKVVPKYFILDVDGVFTDGSFYYTADGKVMKKFGPEDNDALSLLKDWLHIEVITGDKRGYNITAKRISEDMGLPLSLVSTFKRIEWIKEHFNPAEVVYMGDGIFDPLVFREVFYSIAPANAFYTAKDKADFVTTSSGGSGAVAEASLHLMDRFFQPFTYETLQIKHGSGAWKL